MTNEYNYEITRLINLPLQ